MQRGGKCRNVPQQVLGIGVISYCLSMQIFLHSRVCFSYQQPKLKHFYLFFNRCTDTLFKQKHRHYCKQLFDNSLTVVQPQSSFCCSKPIDTAYLNKVTDNFSQRQSFGFNHEKKINDAYFEAFCVVSFFYCTVYLHVY